jgi:hypothetical protein
VAEWFKAAVLKTARGFTLPRGFESHPFRQIILKLLYFLQLFVCYPQLCLKIACPCARRTGVCATGGPENERTASSGAGARGPAAVKPRYLRPNAAPCGAYQRSSRFHASHGYPWYMHLAPCCSVEVCCPALGRRCLRAAFAVNAWAAITKASATTTKNLFIAGLQLQNRGRALPSYMKVIGFGPRM